MTLPSSPDTRKGIPIFSGCVKYFPDALAAVAELSRIGNDQHHPGEPLHWDKNKSTDELDALTRHLTAVAEDFESRDTDGVLEATKVAWRALANLQRLADSGVNVLACEGSEGGCDHLWRIVKIRVMFDDRTDIISSRVCSLCHTWDNVTCSDD